MDKDTILRVGFFDSGHGGLEILRESLDRHNGEFFYIADELYHPYGKMELSELQRRCLDLTDLLVNELKCDVIVLACNTATAYAIDVLRQQFKLPFVGVEPYLNYISTVAPEKVAAKRVGALVTPNTLKAPRFKELKQKIDPNDLVSVVALGELAPLIEEFMRERDPKTFEEKLSHLFKPLLPLHWEETILGCTHYPLIKDYLEKILKTRCVSPTKAVVDQLIRVAPIGDKERVSGHFQFLNTVSGKWREALITEFLPLP